MRVIVQSATGRHELTAAFLTQDALFSTQESILNDVLHLHHRQANRIVRVLDKLGELNAIEDLSFVPFFPDVGEFA